MKKIAVVILQYNNPEDTTKFIENLRSLNWNDIDYHFIIVDNASTNGCGLQTQALYANEQNITVLLSEENLGFAKGNNLGIEYAQKHFCPDFIAVSNNDIEIQDAQFFQKLCHLYASDPFAVFGPDIFSVINNYHQSPIRNTLYTAQQLESLLPSIDKKLRRLRFIKKLHIYGLLRFLKRLLGKSGRPDADDFHRVQYDVVVQGAFFVLSKDYMKEYPTGLHPETFMYMEEDILAYLCQKKNLTIRYSPELKVLHYEGAATRKASKKRIDKFIFELEHTKHSAQILLNLIRQNKGANNS